ncbi:hypothetical protein RS82_01869 [Microbacterium trichothecenolyticum]|uniref:Uncharacterized protein n=1 Tax=Microbacterium trichothecenolyticum TaxID=69370 RepID=A0A0M2HDW7_MICTR|nr:hypothetical protein RS82_01869 [Microbacterium trichothecenolyticum]
MTRALALQNSTDLVGQRVRNRSLGCRSLESVEFCGWGQDPAMRSAMNLAPADDVAPPSTGISAPVR